MTDVAAARTFLRTHARSIEIRLAEFALDGVSGAAAGVIAGLEAYRNPDGGFGHGLEPDTLTPESQPLAVDSAFDILSDIAESTTDPAVRERAAGAVRATLDYLDAAAEPDGGLRLVFPSVMDYPHADHWAGGEFPAALNPTAKVLGNARALGLAHPWMERATEFCRAAVAGLAPGTDVHTVLCTLRFLETDLDRDQSRRAYEELLGKQAEWTMFAPMPEEGYGLTPLDLAPSPSSPRREFFADASVEAHLDALAAGQLADGGWPLTWNPPGPGPELAWRGVVTLHALRILRAYGRIRLADQGEVFAS